MRSGLFNLADSKIAFGAIWRNLARFNTIRFYRCALMRFGTIWRDPLSLTISPRLRYLTRLGALQYNSSRFGAIQRDSVWFDVFGAIPGVGDLARSIVYARRVWRYLTRLNAFQRDSARFDISQDDFIRLARFVRFTAIRFDSAFSARFGVFRNNGKLLI